MERKTMTLSEVLAEKRRRRDTESNVSSALSSRTGSQALKKGFTLPEIPDDLPGGKSGVAGVEKPESSVSVGSSLSLKEYMAAKRGVRTASTVAPRDSVSQISGMTSATTHDLMNELDLTKRAVLDLKRDNARLLQAIEEQQRANERQAQDNAQIKELLERLALK
jgi:hypothetical protein